MKVQMALNLQNVGNAQVLIDADHYITNMTGNAHFMAADIVAQVMATKDAVNELRKTINAPISDTRTDDIRIARDVLNRNLKILADRVASVANAPSTPDANRVDIVHSAGMNIKNQVHPQKHKFSVRNTDISGTVHLTAQGRIKAHEWQYTDDIVSFTNRIPVDTTTKASTDIPNLQRGKEYAFFHKAIIAEVKTDWEGPVFLMVI